MTSITSPSLTSSRAEATFSRVNSFNGTGRSDFQFTSTYTASSSTKTTRPGKIFPSSRRGISASISSTTASFICSSSATGESTSTGFSALESSSEESSFTDFSSGGSSLGVSATAGFSELESEEPVSAGFSSLGSVSAKSTSACFSSLGSTSRSFSFISTPPANFLPAKLKLLQFVLEESKPLPLSQRLFSVETSRVQFLQLLLYDKLKPAKNLFPPVYKYWPSFYPPPPIIYPPGGRFHKPLPVVPP